MPTTSSDQIIRLVYDASTAKNELNIVNNLLKKLGLTFDAMTSATLRNNAANKTTGGSFKVLTQQGIELSTTLEQLATKGQRTSFTLKDMSDKAKIATGGMQALLDAQQKLVDAQSKLRASNLANQQGKAGASAFAAQLGQSPAQAAGFAPTAAETDKLNLALTSVVKLLANGTPFTTFEAIARDSLAGITRNYVGTKATIQKVINDVITAHKKLGSTAKKESDDAAAAMIRNAKLAAAEQTKQLKLTQREAEAFGVRMAQVARQIANTQNSARAFALQSGLKAQLGGVPANADPAQLASFNASLGKLTEFVAKGKISANELRQIFNNVQNGITVNMNGVAGAVARASASVLNSFRAMGGQTTSTLNQMIAALTKTSQSLQSFNLSPKSLIRIAEIQAFHTILFRLINAFQQSIVGARDLSLAIAEIRTISQSAQLSTERWTSEVIKLSAAFGETPKNVAEAAYETISNQVAKGAQTFTFLEEALRFSKIAVTDSATSVNLLTAVLNSFQLEAGQTRQVADSLFKTIDLGRVRAIDMADTFGRVGVFAKELGLNFNEVNAAIATLTIKGVSFERVQTELINVISKLAKPTEAMTKLFKEWGVSSGPAAVETFTFLGVLRKLKEEAAKGGDEFAGLNKLFRDIRAIGGASGLTGGTGLDALDTALLKISDSAEQADEALNIVLESTGQKFKQETAKITAYFLELGDAFNKMLLNLGEGFGGFGELTISVINNLLQLVTILPQLTVLFGLFETAVFLAKLETISFNAVMVALAANPVGLFLTVVGALAAAYLYLSESTAEANHRIQNEIDDFKKHIAASQKQIFKELDDATNSYVKKQVADIDSVIGPALRFGASLTAQNNSILESLNQLAEQTNENLKKSFSNAKDSISDSMKSLRQQISDSKKAVDDLVSNFKDRRFDNTIKDFNNAIALDDEKTRDEKSLSFGDKLIGHAKKAYNAGDIDLARKYFEQVEKFQDQAVQNGLNREKKAREEVLKAEETLQKAQEARAASIITNKQHKGSAKADFNVAKDYQLAFAAVERLKKAEVEANADRNAALAQQLKLRHELEALDLAEIARQKQTAADAEKKLKTQEAAFNELQRLLPIADNFDKKFKNATPADKLKSFDELQAKITGAAKTAGISKDAELALTRDLANKRELISLQSINDETAKHLSQINSLNTAYKDYLSQIEKTKNAQTQAEKDSVSAQSTIQENIHGLAASVKDIADNPYGSGRPTNVSKADIAAKIKEFNKALAESRNVLVDDNLTIEQQTESIGRLQAAYRTLITTIHNGDTTKFNKTNIGSQSAPEVFEKMNEALTRYKSASQSFQKLTSDLNLQEATIASIQQTLALIPKEFADIGAAATQTTPKTAQEFADLATTLGNNVQALVSINEQLVLMRANAAAAIAASSAAAGGPIGAGAVQSTGGFAAQYYATGGFPGGPRGTDTIPTWLTPGEGVINAKAARSYAPLIRAMNNMRFENLASNNNTTIGDVHIHTNAENVTAVNIGRRLQRDVRRGNLKLK